MNCATDLLNNEIVSELWPGFWEEIALIFKFWKALYKGKGMTFWFFLFLANWDSGLMSGTGAAILDHEVDITWWRLGEPQVRKSRVPQVCGASEQPEMPAFLSLSLSLSLPHT
jgi:hypothetical protein